MRSITEFLGVLGQTALRFARSRSDEELYAHALDAACAMTDAGRASLLLFDREGRLRFEASRGLSDAYRAAVDGHAPWVRGAIDPAPVLAPDALADAGLAPHRDALTSEGIRALAFFPLVTAAGTIGKLGLYWAEPRKVPRAQVELLRALAGLAAFAIDRQRAGRELEEERRLFVGGPSVVFKWQNRAGWPVEYASPNVEQVFGYAPDALAALDGGYATLVHPDDLARVGEEVAEYTREARPWFEQEYRVRRADGAWRWIYDFTSPVRASTGEVTHYLGYVIDETDRRAALEALSQRQRVESLGVMAGGVAHDFNNLLVGVMGNAGLALQLLPETSDAARYVKDVVIGAQRASALTRQLLAYSGKAAFQLEPLALAPLVGECVRLLGSVLSQRAELSIDVPANLEVLADATQLRQLVINLLTNASDALDGATGRILVSASDVEVRSLRADFAPAGQSLPPGAYVLIEVEDTGVGMDEATAQHVFDPFFTTKGQGRGLGLSAVLGIVRSHRGAVNVVSRPRRGSSFQLFLPAARHADGASPAGRPATQPTDRSRILVVDDEASVRSIVERVLSLEGHDVTGASSAEAALEVLAARPDGFDVVLMDLSMPKLSGLEALAILRRSHPTLPVVIMSGYSRDGIQAPPNDPATHVLEKPFELDQLREIIALALRGR